MNNKEIENILLAIKDDIPIDATLEEFIISLPRAKKSICKRVYKTKKEKLDSSISLHGLKKTNLKNVKRELKKEHSHFNSQEQITLNLLLSKPIRESITVILEERKIKDELSEDFKQSLLSERAPKATELIHLFSDYIKGSEKMRISNSNVQNADIDSIEQNNVETEIGNQTSSLDTSIKKSKKKSNDSNFISGIDLDSDLIQDAKFSKPIINNDLDSSKNAIHDNRSNDHSVIRSPNPIMVILIILVLFVLIGSIFLDDWELDLELDDPLHNFDPFPFLTPESQNLIEIFLDDAICFLYRREYYSYLIEHYSRLTGKPVGNAIKLKENATNTDKGIDREDIDIEKEAKLILSKVTKRTSRDGLTILTAPQTIIFGKLLSNTKGILSFEYGKLKKNAFNLAFHILCVG